MKIGETLYVKDRKSWREWLEKNHNKEKEIWLIYYKKHTGKARIPYEDAVEEALCFGWIDSTVKGIDKDKYAQRYSPRNPKSGWSQPNKHRVKKLIRLGKMMPAGLAVFRNEKDSEYKIPLDIEKVLKADEKAWQNFQKFPKSYQKIRVLWIDSARKRPEEFKKRLNYFVKKTSQNEKFGMVI